MRNFINKMESNLKAFPEAVTHSEGRQGALVNKKKKEIIVTMTEVFKRFVRGKKTRITI